MKDFPKPGTWVKTPKYGKCQVVGNQKTLGRVVVKVMKALWMPDHLLATNPGEPWVPMHIRLEEVEEVQ